MKKFIMLLGLVIGFSFGTSVVFGEGNSVTEEEIDVFLINAGVPDEVLERWEYDQKLDLFNTGKEGKVEYDTTETSVYVRDENTGELIDSSEIRPSGDFSTMATIGTDRLKKSHDIFTLTLSGVKHKRVYLDYEWVKAKRGGTKGDKIGIAVPDGWQIVAQSYACNEYQSGAPVGLGWTHKATCGGGTYDLNFYGAVWSLTRTDDVFHRGWAKLDMKRTSTSAQLKVLGKYVEDTGTSTSWSLSWGPASVSISGNKSNNQVSWDTAFTY